MPRIDTTATSDLNDAVSSQHFTFFAACGQCSAHMRDSLDSIRGFSFVYLRVSLLDPLRTKTLRFRID